MSGVLQSNLQNGVYSNDNASASLTNCDFMIGERASRGSSLKCARVGTANNNYNGQLVATLGY